MLQPNGTTLELEKKLHSITGKHHWIMQCKENACKKFTRALLTTFLKKTGPTLRQNYREIALAVVCKMLVK